MKSVDHDRKILSLSKNMAWKILDENNPEIYMALAWKKIMILCLFMNDCSFFFFLKFGCKEKY